MAKRTFVSWHACRQSGRNVIAGFTENPRVIPCMAGRTRSCNNPGVRIGFLHRRPGGRSVANFTTRRGRHVVRQLNVHARIGGKVTTRAVRRLGMRIGEQRHPRQTGTMTDVTFLSPDRNMHCRLAGSSSPVMASRTSRSNTCMRERGWFPGRRRVADIARLGSRYMHHILAQSARRCVCATVTSHTTTVWRYHTVMGHRCRVEGCVVLVACIASRRRRDMQGRFTQRIGPVVAGRATASYHSRMVEGTGCPSRSRVVTGTALRRRRNMRRRLDLRILRNIGTAMARGTACQPRMAHGSRRPGGISLVVACVALTGYRNVRGRLGQGIYCDISATVTGRTVTNRHRSGRRRMAHQGRAERSGVFVTGIALSRRRNMCGRFGQRSRSIVAR